MTTFPGYVADVEAGDTLDPSGWGNAIRDRAAQVFSDTTTRDAAIPTPQVGQFSIITTGTGSGLYQYAGSTVQWRAPWNLPWGAIGSLAPSNATSASATAADVSGGSVTFTAVANRNYRIFGECSISGTVNNDLGELALVDGAGTIKTGRGIVLATSTVADGSSISFVKTYSAGSQTTKLQVRRASGTGTVTFSGLSIYIEDVGPAGAPS
jgi:hypothetical protein